MPIKKTLSEANNSQLRVGESLDDLLLEGIFRCRPGKGFVFVNASFLRMFAYSSLKQLRNVSEGRLYANEDRQNNVDEKIRNDGSVRDLRVLLRKRSGDTFWGLISCRKIVINDELFLEGRILDVSNEERVEQELNERNYQIEKITSELDRFLYSASHDIRAPISSIMGIVHLMKLDLKDESSRMYVTMLDTCAEKLDQFVRHLTSFAKNSKIKLNDELVSFKDLVEGILNELGKRHPDFTKVRCTMDIREPNVFYSDLERLYLIFYNVLKNAFDYHDGRKTDKVLSIEIRTQADRAVIEIADNGIGIPAAHLPHVFEMFYRATSQSKGSGLGLYTTRETVSRIGGVVTIDSEHCVGTKVKIVIPNSTKGKLINKKLQLRRFHRSDT